LLYAELLQECQSANGSIGKVAQIISQDVAMTAKVLQLLNSAFFGFRRTVSSPLQAVQLLGLDTIKALVLWSEVFSRFNQTRMKGFSMSALWTHSIAASAIARQIAAMEHADRLVVDDAGVAGLLHDSGRLVLATNLPEQFDQAKALATDQRIPLWAAEREVFGETHAAVGAYLLALWAIPDSIVEAVAFHHAPLNADTRAFGALAAVHAANALVDERAEQGVMPSQIDVQYLSELGLAERLDLWRQVCQVPDGTPQ
jgi:HD-like signal output (HDOD) protein